MTPTQQDSRIGPDNVGGAAHRAARGSVALADQVLHRRGAPKSNISHFTQSELKHIVRVDEGLDPIGDEVNRVHRLKALGNGVVPAVAHIFAGAIYDQLERRRRGELA